MTAVTVPPEYRRLGVAQRLMHVLERVSEWDRAYFVDLFVRKVPPPRMHFPAGLQSCGFCKICLK